MRNTHRPDGRPTKWDFITPAERIALRKTPFLDCYNKPGACSVCGTPLPTEADFAKHFVLRDVRYLGLGDCPRDEYPELVNWEDCLIEWFDIEPGE
jgi:hypothetical protein